MYYDIKTYIYILESTGALRAPLILLSQLPVEVLRVEVQAIDIRFDHVRFDAGPSFESIQPFISAHASEMQKPCWRKFKGYRLCRRPLVLRCMVKQESGRTTNS